MTTRTRRPTNPGDVLRYEFLEPLDWSRGAIAARIGCDVEALNALVNGHVSLEAEMALQLSEVFGTKPEFWLNLQKAVDLFDAQARASVHEHV